MACTITEVAGGWNARPGSMICPITGKRATRADWKLAALVPADHTGVPGHAALLDRAARHQHAGAGDR